MNPRVLAGVTCLLVAGATHASDNSGITGGGSLRPAAQPVASQDGRFHLKAGFQRAPATVQQAGGFSLTAKLTASVPTATCSPVGDLIFRNGFD